MLKRFGLLLWKSEEGGVKMGEVASEKCYSFKLLLGKMGNLQIKSVKVVFLQ